MVGAACGVAALAGLLAGCGGSAESAAPGRSASPPAVTSRAVDAQASRVAVAEHVKTLVEGRISPDETRFGSGTGSPCATSSARMFTAACGSAATATGADAAFVRQQIQPHQGFATLRSVTDKLMTAVSTYSRLGCAANPTAAATRHACLDPAAVIAQGFPDLRDGANLGLHGA